MNEDDCIRPSFRSKSDCWSTTRAVDRNTRYENYHLRRVQPSVTHRSNDTHTQTHADDTCRAVAAASLTALQPDAETAWQYGILLDVHQGHLSRLSYPQTSNRIFTVDVCVSYV